MSFQALILVDLQNDYFPGGKMELVGIERAAENAAKILGFARENQLPVFHIQHIAASESASFFLPNTRGADHHESVRPLNSERVFKKHFPSAFRETDLEAILRQDKLNDLCIVGAMSHMCIDATTRAAFDAGFSCTVVQDACATRDLEFNGRKIAAADVHGSFMAALSSPYAAVLETADIA